MLNNKSDAEKLLAVMTRLDAAIQDMQLAAVLDSLPSAGMKVHTPHAHAHTHARTHQLLHGLALEEVALDQPQRLQVVKHLWQHNCIVNFKLPLQSDAGM